MTTRHWLSVISDPETRRLLRLAMLADRARLAARHAITDDAFFHHFDRWNRLGQRFFRERAELAVRRAAA